MNATAEWIDGQLLIPDLLRAAPQTRPVLDRYGLRGCGGEHGPVESLGFFAKAHDVPLPRLLAELREATLLPTAAVKPEAPSVADAIYRPFFKAGIAVVLTLGAVWGAYLLLRIGFGGTFRAVGLHEVNAHGQAQIFGWVGLFVMGFAYQAFPRFKHTTLSHPRLALASLGVMLAGILGRSVCEPLAASYAWLSAPAVAAAGLEVLACVLFVGIILATWRASGKPLAVYDYYILSSFGWFVAQAVYEAVYLAATFAADGTDRLVPLVARWQGGLREMQIHGFALLIILGVSQRLFPHFYGFRSPNRRLSLAALAALNLAVAGGVVGSVLLRDGGALWKGVWYGSVLLLAGTTVVLVRDWRIFSRPPESDRSLKFLRAAYVWLFVSLAMLALLPLYQYAFLPRVAPDSKAVADGFSHAYYGAVRHAITVGFVSLMIVGVAAKVVPTLNGVDVRRLSALWGPFLLINAGCALRVVSQTLTDFTGGAFPVAGVSGVLEVLGLALWGAHLWAVMAGRARLRAAPAATAYDPGNAIVATDRVGDVLGAYPGLLDTFLALGFRPLANPWLRKVLAPLVTIEQACRQTGAEAAGVVKALNEARARLAGGKRPLPVLDSVSARQTSAPEETEGACCPTCASHAHR
jgi:hypothetical protein